MLNKQHNRIDSVHQTQPMPLPDVETERQRLEAVHRYGILDTPPDGTFDSITILAAHILKTPVSIVSIVDTDRIWFKSHHGLDIEEIPRSPGLCASAILGDLPYILPDASKDPRSLANPLVAGEFGLRFYAAVPLKTRDGYNLGTLCCIDFQPSAITETQQTMLEHLAALVMEQMELRLAARQIFRIDKELHEINRLLREKAEHDALTGLPNRETSFAHLNKMLEQADNEKQPLSVVIFDIDHFKQVNDEHGHIVGDQVLSAVAQRLSHACRRNELIGRIGGEEFMAVLYPCGGDEAQRSAERFSNAISRSPIVLADKTAISISLSGGIYTASALSKHESLEVYRHADTALLQSKRDGRNRLTVGPIQEVS